MKKILRVMSLGMFVVLPITFGVSCGKTKSGNNYIEFDKGQALFLEGNIQNNEKRAHINMPEIRREKIKTYNMDLSSSFGVPLVSGGFGETRHFYSSNNKLSIHLGDDVFVKAHTKIVAPYKGEVIASWGKTMEGELGGGFGTQVVMKVQVKDMNLSNEAKVKLKGETEVYLTFGHLSSKTSELLGGIVNKQLHLPYHKQFYNWVYNTSISPEHTLKVKKGQVIGEVGTIRENGGWIPHVHVEVYKGSSPHFAKKRISKYKPEAGWTTGTFAKNFHMFSSVKGEGVFMLSGTSNKKRLLAQFKGGDYDFKTSQGKIIHRHKNYNESKLERDGIIDPNIIYKLWKKTSKEFTLQ